MSTPTSAMGAKSLSVGTVYVPEPVAVLLIQLFQAWAQSSIVPVPSTVAGDQNEVGIAEPVTSPAPQAPPAVPSPPSEPVMDAAPTTAPGDVGVEVHDAEGGTVAASTAPGREAPPATSPAGGGPPPLPGPPVRARRAWSPRRWRRLRPSTTA